MRWHPRCFSLLSFGAPCALLLLLLVVQLQETVTAPSSKGLLQHELLSRQRRANTPELAPNAPTVGSLNVSAKATPPDLNAGGKSAGTLDAYEDLKFDLPPVDLNAGGKGAETLEAYEDLNFDLPPVDLNADEQEAIAKLEDLDKKKKKEEKEKKKQERKKAEQEKKRRKEEERTLKDREAAQEQEKKRREEEERTLKDREAAQEQEKKRREEEERTLKDREAAQEQEKKRREEEERILKDREAAQEWEKKRREEEERILKDLDAAQEEEKKRREEEERTLKDREAAQEEEKKRREEEERTLKDREAAQEQEKKRREEQERTLKDREAAQEEEKKRREEEERTLKEREAAQEREKKRREEEERTLKDRDAAQEQEKKRREEQERTLKEQEAHAKSREPKDTFGKETEGQSSQSDESFQPDNPQTAVLPIAAKSVGADFAVNIPSVSQTSFSTTPAAAAPTAPSASAWSTPTSWTPAPQGSPAPGTTPGVSGPTSPVLGLPRSAASSRYAGPLIPVTVPSTSQAYGATSQAQFRSPLASASAPVPREQILSRYLHDVYQFADTKQLLEMVKRGQPLPPQDYQGVRINYKITGHNVNPVTLPQPGGGVTSWTPTPSAYSALPVAPSPVAVNPGAIPAAPIATIRRPLYYVSFEGKQYPVFANAGDAMAAANQQMQTQRVLHHQQPLVPPTNQNSQVINVPIPAFTQLSPNGKTLQPWISSPAVVSIPGTTTVVSNQSPSMQWQKYLMPNLLDGSIPSVSNPTLNVAPATSSVAGVTIKGGQVDMLIPDLSPMPGVPVTVKQLPLGSPTIFPPQSQQQFATPWAQGTPGSPYTVTVYASHNP